MDEMDLADWRRRVAALYARIRASDDPAAAWADWRNEREDLFLNHPQSPLPEDQRRSGPAYFDHVPGARVKGRVVPARETTILLPASSGEPMSATRFAIVHFTLGEAEAELPLFWLSGYAGGLFLAFRDATSGTTTYGGGRYLLDSAKGADLGGSEEELVLDFNLAYQPSCSYSPRWSCPLPIPGATLGFPVEAGEKLRDNLKA
jgi:uncharacterized protein